MEFLRLHSAEVADDPYALALVTYALHLEQDMFVINGNLIQAPPKTTAHAKKMLEKLELKAKGTMCVRRCMGVLFVCMCL